MLTAGTLVFLLLGQSNMDGWRSESGELPESLQTVPTNCHLLGMDDFRLGPGDDFGDREWFGPEVSLMHALHEEMPDHELVFVKVARGGHSVTAFLPSEQCTEDAPEDDRKRAGSLRQELQRLLAVVAQDFSENHIAGAFVYQGERDARIPALAENYEANLDEFVGWLRDLSDSPKLPIFMVRVSPPQEMFSERERIRSIQEAAQNRMEAVRWVDADDAAKADDDLHHTAIGQIVVGERLAAAWKESVANTPTEQTP